MDVDAIAPLRADLRLRNNRLVRLREELGFKSARAFALASGINYQTYVAIESMREGPLTPETGEVREVAARVMSYHGLSFDELWPEAVRAVQKNRSTAEIDEATALRLMSSTPPELPAPPDAQLDAAETSTALQRLLDSCPPRENLVIRLRIFELMDLRSVGRELGLSQERVRQLEARGLARIRSIIRTDEQLALLFGVRYLAPPPKPDPRERTRDATLLVALQRIARTREWLSLRRSRECELEDRRQRQKENRWPAIRS